MPQFAFTCNTADSFLPGPNSYTPRGYVTSFALAAQGTPYKPDITVTLPPPVTPPYPGLTRVTGADGQSEATVVGIIETFHWNGGVGDPIQVDFLVSQETAVQIRTLQATGLHNLNVASFGYYIENYDPQARTWYSEAFPVNPTNLQGVISGASNPLLNVSLQGQPVKAGVDISVYKVSIGFLPQATHTSTLYFATSATLRLDKAWGLTVGSLASQAISG